MKRISIYLLLLFSAARAARSQSCETATLTIPAVVSFDTPVTWMPSQCVMTLQGYEGNSLAGQALTVPSGMATIGQIATHTTASVLVKIWAFGSAAPADAQTVTVHDCQSPKFTFATAPGFDTPITWVLPGCVPGRIEAYKDGQMVGRFDNPQSGEKTFGDITGRQPGLIEMRLYTTTLVDSRFVQISKCVPDFLALFSDDFQLNKGWPDFITEEIPKSSTSCYNTGVGGVTRRLRYGKPSLCVTPNQAGWNYSNHMIVGNRLSDTGQGGVWSYSVWFYLPTDVASAAETNPEISVQDTVPGADGTQTYIAGVQHRVNPFDTANLDTWAVWAANDPHGPWVNAATRSVPRNRWLKLELVADFDTHRYVSLTVTDAEGVTILTQPLAGFEIAAETRPFEPAFVVTLEAENLNTCPNPHPTMSTVCYADLTLRRLPLTVSSAMGMAAYSALGCE